MTVQKMEGTLQLYSGEGEEVVTSFLLGRRVRRNHVSCEKKKKNSRFYRKGGGGKRREGRDLAGPNAEEKGGTPFKVSSKGKKKKVPTILCSSKKSHLRSPGRKLTVVFILRRRKERERNYGLFVKDPQKKKDDYQEEEKKNWKENTVACGAKYYSSTGGSLLLFFWGEK